MVEDRGFEPLTSAMRRQCSPAEFALIAPGTFPTIPYCYHTLSNEK